VKGRKLTMLMSINEQEIVRSKSNELLDENRKESQFSINKQKVFKGSYAIHALSHCLPDTIVTATEIQDAITAFPGHMLEIERRTGMKEKRVFKGDESVVDHALKAIDNLIARGTLSGSKIPMDEIDLIIYFGISRHYAEPATAVLIQHELGLNGPMAFDVSNACLGFTDAICIADSMIASKRIRYALLVSAEKVSFIGDRAIDEINSGGNVFEQFASLTVSDGALSFQRTFTINVVANLVASDINKDSLINVTDLGILMSDFGKTAQTAQNPRSDINSDGNVNVIDLGILMSEWK